MLRDEATIEILLLRSTATVIRTLIGSECVSSYRVSIILDRALYTKIIRRGSLSDAQ